MDRKLRVDLATLFHLWPHWLEQRLPGIHDKGRKEYRKPVLLAVLWLYFKVLPKHFMENWEQEGKTWTGPYASHSNLSQGFIEAIVPATLCCQNQ
jgi:hypothetical protein